MQFNGAFRAHLMAAVASNARVIAFVHVLLFSVIKGYRLHGTGVPACTAGDTELFKHAWLTCRSRFD